jgi:Ras-related protein Rab-21
MSGGGVGKSYQFKVVLLGEGCVGKTSLMNRYIHDAFNDKHLSTLQAAFLKKKLKVGQNSCELAIWVYLGFLLFKLSSRNFI